MPSGSPSLPCFWRQTIPQSASGFFTANIRKAYTRKAYLKAAIRFSDWCQALKRERDQVQPVHVAVSIEHLGGERATPIGAAKRRFVRCD